MLVGVSARCDTQDRVKMPRELHSSRGNGYLCGQDAISVTVYVRKHPDLTLEMQRGTLSPMTEREDEMREKWIVSDPNVMMGKPVVAGTRITVELILEKLAAGETVEQVLDAHPRLTLEAIRAALAFAREALRADVVYPVAEPVA